MSSPGVAATVCANSMAQVQCGFSGTVMAMCIGGQWAPSTCACIPDTGSTVTAQSGAPKCGDGIVQADRGEMCEQATTSTTCASLIPGASGFLNCVDCKYDMSLCTMPMKMSTGGTGAAVGGTGASTMGTAGSGGSGRM